MSFNAWFAALPVVLKILVILGIVIGSFGVGASFVTSTLKVWKAFGDLISRRENSEKKEKEQGPEKPPEEGKSHLDRES